jgi:lysozyme
MASETLIQQFEGLKLEAYQDSVGIWTIGYGNIRNLDTNQPIKKGDVITLDTANKWLSQEVTALQAKLKKLIKVSVTDNQFNAITSLVYNIGIGAFTKSTLLKLLNAGSPKEEVAKQFLRWNKAGGKEIKGLTNRRQAEYNLFLK